jgi:uncharacterized protein (TIGR00730 family)
MTKIVTVFGSSKPLENEEEYQTAYNLGKELGRRGYSVCSGGYQGIMDAVSRGAVEEGSEAIGVTVNIFGARKSKYLTREIECGSLLERLGKLIELGNAYIILRGGTGTLVELSLVWEMINKRLIPNKPAACHGEMWSGLVKTMDDRMAYEKRDTGLVKSFLDIDDCVNYISEKLNAK